MAKKLKRFLKSFTLIELIIVIAIIAVLGASAFLLLSQWMSKSRDSRRITDLRALEKTIQISFIGKEGVNYPDPDPKIEIKYDKYGVLWYQGKFGETMTNFVGNLNKIPKDPRGSYYEYSLTQDKKFYQLLAILENEKQVSYGIENVYANDYETTFILTNYRGYLIKKIGEELYLIKTETLMVDPAKIEEYSGEYELNFQEDVLKQDESYKNRSELITGNISGLLSDDPLEQQKSIEEIQTKFPELNNQSAIEEIKKTVGATTNIQMNNTQECVAHENNGYIFDTINHGETQTKTKTESITDGTNTLQLSATCNNGVLTYGEESSSIECTNDKVLSNGSCVSDICQGTMPDNAQLNGTQSVSGTWGYSETGGVCKFKCIEGYNYDNGSSCELNTYTVSGSFGANANGATINVCGSNVTATTDGTFTTTRNHGSICNNITATRTGYTCTTSTQGPSSLTANVTNIAGSCVPVTNWTGDPTNGYLLTIGGVSTYPTSCNNLLTSTSPSFKVGTTSAYNGTKFLDGVYRIKPTSDSAFKAYCDMTTDSGGWTLLGSIKKGVGTIYWSNAIDSNYTALDISGKDSSTNWGKVDSKLQSWVSTPVNSVLVREGTNYDKMTFSSTSSLNSLLSSSTLTAYTNVTLNFNVCQNAAGYCWSPSIGNVLRTPNNTPCSNSYRNVNGKGINLVRYHDGYCHSGGNSYVNRGFFVTSTNTHVDSAGVGEGGQTVNKITSGVSFWGK